MNLKSNNQEFFFNVKNSFLKRSWVKKKVDKRVSLQVSQDFSFSLIESDLISSRCDDISQIKNYLKPTLKELFPHFSLFNDMELALMKTCDKIKNNEKIGVLGDYDVDGLCSIALLKKFFFKLNQNIFSYIPDRLKEGYGPNKKAIDKMKSDNVTLVLMVDCGSTSKSIVDYAQKLKIDVIIIDHHKTDENLPINCPLINPNSLKDKSEFNYLCATGLTFIYIYFLYKMLLEKKLIQNNEIDLLNCLDLVALATVCDVVPLVKLNRAFVKQGLKVLSKRSNLGLKILADEFNLEKKPDEEDLGFFFGPRLNAGGRVGKADIGEELLHTEDIDKAEKLSQQLNTFNYQRKLIEDSVYEEANIILKSKKLHELNSLVLENDNWHQGVLGIVASRLKEKLNIPVFILSKNENFLKGSGRSISGVDIGSFAIFAKQKGIIVNGGGHEMAAGVTLKKEKLNDFIKIFKSFVNENDISHVTNNYLYIDNPITINGINEKLIETINLVSPYGNGNSKPLFAMQNIKIINPKVVGESKQHISFIGSDSSGNTIKCIAFRSVDNELGNAILNKYKNSSFQLAGYIKQSKWSNKDFFELIIEDGSIE